MGIKTEVRASLLPTDVNRPVHVGGPWIFAGVVLLLVLHAGYERIWSNPLAVSGFLSAVIVLCAGYTWIRLRRKTSLTFSFALRRPHLIQCFVQTGVFVYWGSAWSPVYEQAPIITAQICFAYGCEAFFSWRRFGHWRLGFGPFPVVLSTNLFLWFVDDFVGLQFLMIGLAYWSRDVLCVQRDGRRQHLFNPSAFALGVAAIAVVAFKVPEITYGESIARTLGNPEYPYLWIFLMGFIVQAFFKVTLVTMSAAIAMVLAGAFYSQIVGTYYYIDTAIPIAVFLGMNLLVTDPATSPQNRLGRIIFGALYGLLVFVSYEALRQLDGTSILTGDPMNISWLDKLLCVPFLNLLARPIDRLASNLTANTRTIQWFGSNAVHMGIWVVAFLAIRPSLVEHEGRNISFWISACEAGIGRACIDKVRLHALRCDQGLAEDCLLQGDAFETGNALTPDSRQAMQAYRRACQLQLAQGCLSFYRMCDTEQLSCEPDEQNLALEKACTTGSVQGCQILARRIVFGKMSKISLDEAVRSFGKGCRIGAPSACAGLHELGLAHLHPDRPKSDPGFVRAAFTSACNGQYADACVNLALMEIRGEGGQRDIASARARLQTTCNQGHAKACRFQKRLERVQSP